MSPVPRLQLDILSKLDHVSVLEAGTYPTLADAVLDGLIGYSLSGSPKGIAADLIHWANGQPAPILSLDVPSGFDATRGIIRNPAIQATATLTIALPKICQSSPDLAAHMGDLYCIDIGVPPSLYARLDPPLIIPPMFGASDIIRVK
jgi:NAD(P)H-hydrate epimerase